MAATTPPSRSSSAGTPRRSRARASPLDPKEGTAMPVTPTYPGVYIEEVPSLVRTIAGVATSITAFIGRARRGPIDDPVRVQGFAEFYCRFGGLWRDSMMSYAVQQFFLNGGTDALIVRVFDPGAVSLDDAHARVDLPAGVDGLVLRAARNPARGERPRGLRRPPDRGPRGRHALQPDGQPGGGRDHGDQRGPPQRLRGPGQPPRGDDGAAAGVEPRAGVGGRASRPSGRTT